jgi:hypothetical protein
MTEQHGAPRVASYNEHDERMGAAEARLVVYPRRGKLALLALGALAFVISGLVIGAAASWRPYPVTVVATYVGVPFFGFCLLHLLSRLVVRRPAVVVSEEGIWDNATALGVGMIRWEEVRDVRATSFGTHRMVAIVPKDDAAILARQPPPKRLAMRMNKRLATYLICIPEQTLPMTREELLAEIKRYRAMRRSRGRTRP